MVYALTSMLGSRETIIGLTSTGSRDPARVPAVTCRLRGLCIHHQLVRVSERVRRADLWRSGDRIWWRFYLRFGFGLLVGGLG